MGFLAFEGNFNTNIDLGRVLIDHVEEHTAKMVLDEGFWAGMTLYPDTKCTPQRATDIIEVYGSEQIWINPPATGWEDQRLANVQQPSGGCKWTLAVITSKRCSTTYERRAA